MKSKISHIIFLLLIILALHLIGIFGGLYERGIEIDMPQHILGGVVLGLIWLHLLSETNFSRPIILISTIGFVAFVAVAWEVLEFTAWKIFPVFADSFKFYSPTVTDLLGDETSNLVGGILTALYTIRKKIS